MKVTLAQLNPKIGDIEGNTTKILSAIDTAQKANSDLVIFPELILTGYPPKDLLRYPSFVNQISTAISTIVTYSKSTPDLGILVGTPVPREAKTGKPLHNAAILIQNGAIISQHNKSLLPNYDVFEESRYFEPADHIRPVAFKQHTLGISICEDLWSHKSPELAPHAYCTSPVTELSKNGSTLLINISASPFEVGKHSDRIALLQHHATSTQQPILYINQVGGNDELIFDGASCVIGADGTLIAQLKHFNEDIQHVELNTPATPIEARTDIQDIHDALVLGIQDYANKTGLKKTLLGLSGGIDSAVTAALAVEALGPENVLGVLMPSEFSSSGSVDDAIELGQNLGIPTHTFSITPTHHAFLETLDPVFKDTAPGLAEENIQARIRGTLLMGIANKENRLLLTTGNKSEIAVGYCTLYGDMNGGICALGDIYKMQVYALAHYINRDQVIIPEATITKAPSAELRADQTDQDSLPEYDVLDAIIHAYVEEMSSKAELVAAGFDTETIEWVVRTINLNEYKRRQAAPAFKITSKAFSTGRKMPIAARFPT